MRSRRRTAETTLLQGQATLAAGAAVQSKEGGRVWTKIQNRLLDVIEGK